MQGGNSPSSYVAQWSYGRCGGWVHGRMHLYLHYILYIVPPLGAYKSQLGGHIYIFAVVLYGHCLLWLYVYIHIYIYIIDYNCIHSSCQFFGVFLHVRCIPQQNSQWQFFASVLLILTSPWWYEPFGERLASRTFDPTTRPPNSHFWISNSFE